MTERKLEPLRIYSAAEVAEIVFGISITTWYRQKALRARQGFPEPINRFGQGQWLGEALIAWAKRAQGAGATQPAEHNLPGEAPLNVVDFVETCRQRLRSHRPGSGGRGRGGA